MASGRMILLNGTSSSGRSSIARELLDILDDGVARARVGQLTASRPEEA